VIIGERLRAWREYKALSLADMEKRTGLFRYHISRIENGHTTPTLGTLARFARAFEVPAFHLVYEEGDLYPPAALPENMTSNESFARLSRKELRILERFYQLMRQLSDRNRRLLFSLARRMTKEFTERPPDTKRQKTQIKCRNLGSCHSVRNSRHLNRYDRKRTRKPKRTSH